MTTIDADEANLHVNTAGNPHGTIVNYYQPSAPSSPNTGDLLVDSDVTA
jgi:hypothetical protein